MQLPAHIAFADTAALPGGSNPDTLYNTADPTYRPVDIAPDIVPPPSHQRRAGFHRGVRTGSAERRGPHGLA